MRTKIASNMCVCVCVCVCLCVCVSVFISFQRGIFFRLQNVRDMLEGTDQRSCVVNIDLGGSATNWRENDMTY